jgi:hypothetical protein
MPKGSGPEPAKTAEEMRLGERWRKAGFVRLTGDASGEAPQHRMAGKLFQQRLLT